MDQEIPRISSVYTRGVSVQNRYAWGDASHPESLHVHMFCTLVHLQQQLIAGAEKGVFSGSLYSIYIIGLLKFILF